MAQLYHGFVHVNQRSLIQVRFFIFVDDLSVIIHNSINRNWLITSFVEEFHFTHVRCSCARKFCYLTTAILCRFGPRTRRQKLKWNWVLKTHGGIPINTNLLRPNNELTHFTIFVIDLFLTSLLLTSIACFQKSNTKVYDCTDSRKYCCSYKIQLYVHLGREHFNL